MIELLVVVSIIGILSSILIVYLGQARLKAVDARTINQVRQVQNTLLADHSVGTDMPNPGSSGTFYCIGNTNCIFWGILLSNNTAVASALATAFPAGIPTSPVIIDNIQYDDYVYKCKDLNGGVCSAAVYWAQSTYTSCPSGSTQVLEGVGGRVCGQNAGGLGTSNVEIVIIP